MATEAVTVGWDFCDHALERMNSMGLTDEEVNGALADPDLTYDSDERYNRPGQKREVAVKGSIAVVRDRSSRTVITVLWHRRTTRDEGPCEGETIPAASPPDTSTEMPPPTGSKADQPSSPASESTPLELRSMPVGAGKPWSATIIGCRDCGAPHRTVAQALECDDLIERYGLFIDD